MHSIVLAAGFGERLGNLGRTPKALLPFGRGCVLDRVITSIWVPGITCIHVIHNNRTAVWNEGKKTIRKSWPEMFKRWRQSAKWTPEKDKNINKPYIRLINNGIWDPNDRVGAVGDLDTVLRRIDPTGDHGALVVCCDDLFQDPDLWRLHGDTSAITVRNKGELDRRIIDQAAPSAVEVASGRVTRIVGGGHPDAQSIPWRFCGPFYISPSDVPFVHRYVKLNARAGVIPDNIHDLFDAMMEDGRKIRATKNDGRYWTIGTEELYRAVRNENRDRFIFSGRRNIA